MILRHVLKLWGATIFLWFLSGFMDVYLCWTSDIKTSLDINELKICVQCLCSQIWLSYDSEKEYDFWPELRKSGTKSYPATASAASADRVGERPNYNN